MEAVRTSETSVYSETTRRYSLEGSHFHTRRRQNLKSRSLLCILLISIKSTKKKTFFKKLIVAQLHKKFHFFLELEGSLPCQKISPHTDTQFLLRPNLILSSYLHLGLPTDLIFSGFLTKMCAFSSSPYVLPFQYISFS
jgi:hypothetical protein